MLRYIISFFFLLLVSTVSAQLFQPIEAGRQPMVRINVDPTLALRNYLQEPSIYGFDVTVDSEVKQNLFLEAGVGMANVEHTTDLYAYKSNSVYASLGANLNLTQYQSPSDRHIFYVGMHYGFALMNQEASHIRYLDYTGEVFIPQENRTASWLGVSLGLKAEAAKNFFIGWSAESKVRTQLSSGAMQPYYIAGFGKAATRVSLGINFWLSYAISFKPKKYEPLIDLSE